MISLLKRTLTLTENSSTVGNKDSIETAVEATEDLKVDEEEIR